MSTGQLDCPWCGCGWLISCAQCRKAFTFAVVRETDTPLIEFARREVITRGIEEQVTDDELRDWVEDRAKILDFFDVGDVVVYLDGSYWTVDSTNVEFDGYFAFHSFEILPHALARDDPPLLNRTLGDQKYWIDRELPEHE